MINADLHTKTMTKHRITFFTSFIYLKFMKKKKSSSDWTLQYWKQVQLNGKTIPKQKGYCVKEVKEKKRKIILLCTFWSVVGTIVTEQISAKNRYPHHSTHANAQNSKMLKSDIFCNREITNC